jgi:transposase-like protein
METPRTLLEAIEYFSDPDRAHDYAVKVRFPNGVACPRMGCGSADVRYTKTRRLWFCKECQRQFTVRIGTIFEDSPIPFTKWLPAMWLLASNRNGISSCELARALKVTQRTAWFMLHRIRLAMASETHEKLSGQVEADETWVGAKARHMRRTHHNRPSGLKSGPIGNKTPILGIMERGGRMRGWVVPDTRKKTLLPKVYETVEHGAHMFTDSAYHYVDLKSDYVHSVVNHAIEYVSREGAHVNNLEAFWAVLKRTLGGTYIAPRPKHLEAYLDEQIFRFNSREQKDGQRFETAVKQADGRRLTWKTLTAKPKP